MAQAIGEVWVLRSYQLFSTEAPARLELSPHLHRYPRLREWTVAFSTADLG